MVALGASCGCCSLKSGCYCLALYHLSLGMVGIVIPTFRVALDGPTVERFATVLVSSACLAGTVCLLRWLRQAGDQWMMFSSWFGIYCLRFSVLTAVCIYKVVEISTALPEEQPPEKQRFVSTWFRIYMLCYTFEAALTLFSLATVYQYKLSLQDTIYSLDEDFEMHRETDNLNDPHVSLSADRLERRLE